MLLDITACIYGLLLDRITSVRNFMSYFHFTFVYFYFCGKLLFLIGKIWPHCFVILCGTILFIRHGDNARCYFSISQRVAFFQYPHVLDDDVLENIKHWVMDDTIQNTSEECNSESGIDASKPSDIEMLRTYATGLLTVSLSG